ncbi:hypothetical protein BGW80DRAFT_933829 [Lactifluus volemus]|nr:hypothetical protein BGW80DRAFT_933829 [Lactifluus volemus]
MVPPRAGDDFYSNEELDVILDVPRTRIAFDMTSSAIDGASKLFQSQILRLDDIFPWRSTRYARYKA